MCDDGRGFQYVPGAPDKKAAEGLSGLGSTKDTRPGTGGDATAPPYPLFIYLEGQPVAVIGAGRVAERKVATLLERGAHVTVTAPEATEVLQQWAQAGRIVWRQRCYREGDLAGALLVFSATDDRAVNQAVYEEACRRIQLVNVTDSPDYCNAIVPSILRRGRLQIAVSTQGAAPELARDIRLGLEEEFPAWWEPYLDVMAEVRLLIKARVPGPSSTRAPLYAAVAESALKDRIKVGDRPSAEDVYARVVAPLLERGAR